MSVKRLPFPNANIETIQRDKDQLYKLCRKFVEDRKITCGESIWQSDHVTEDIEEFIEKICKTIGYARQEK